MSNQNNNQSGLMSLLNKGAGAVKSAMPYAIPIAQSIPVVGPAIKGLYDAVSGSSNNTNIPSNNNDGTLGKIIDSLSDPKYIRVLDTLHSIFSLKSSRDSSQLQSNIMQQLFNNSGGNVSELARSLEAIAPGIGGRGQVDSSNAKQSKLGEVLGSQKQINSQILMALLQLMQQQQQQRQQVNVGFSNAAQNQNAQQSVAK
ncbi:MAG: hypothetical protein ACRCX2_18490 [Paraclostridium sp.]